MVPLDKYITPNMLIRTFYDNHCFYKCEYDPKLHISLTGRVIQLNDNQFKTFLGYKKPMSFNVIDENMREVGNNYISVVYIDNVIDETVYNQNSIPSGTISKKEFLRRFATKEEYISYFNSLIKKHEELKDIDTQLNDLIEKLQNNYILIKNHVHTFTKYFQELGSDFRQVNIY
jgi:hypothetical protein